MAEHAGGVTGLAAPLPVSGYVLAGGRSSRMGRDKALLELAGKPLLAHAIVKLQRVCKEVSVLSRNPVHGEFGVLVPDLHPGCGPLGGIESALRHSKLDWSLILPIDIPFLPSAMLDYWARETLKRAEQVGTRVSMFVVDGSPQPALLMIHRDLLGFVARAVSQADLKVLRVLMGAAEETAALSGLRAQEVFWRWEWPSGEGFRAGEKGLREEDWRELSAAQAKASSLYFANLNTSGEFAEALRHVDALDT